MATHIKKRVRVWHDDDAVVDLSDRVAAGPTLDGDIDSADWDCEIVFDNSKAWIAANLSLDPLDELSTLNLDGSSALDPILSENHEVQVDIDQGSGWEVFFQGYAGSDVDSVVLSEKRHTVTFRPTGVTMPLREHNRMQKLKYVDRDLATSLLRSILLDSGFLGKLSHVVVADDPLLQVDEYITRETTTWKVLQDAVAVTGFILASRYHAASTAYNDGSGESTPEDGFYLTLYDPLRSKTVADHTWTDECVRRRVNYSIDDVRTWVQVDFQLSNGARKQTSPTMDEDAREKFGIPAGDGTKLHHKMRLVEDGLINTLTEANTYQDFALHDLSTPSPDTIIEIDELYTDADIHDLIEFQFEDYTIEVGVTGVSHDLSPDKPRGETTVRGIIGKVIGLRNYWLGQELTEEERARRRQLWLEGGMVQLAAPTILSRRRYTYQDAEGTTHSAISLHWTKPKEWWFGYTGIFLSRRTNDNYGTEPVLTTRHSYATIEGLPPGETVYIKLRNFPNANMSPQGRR